MTIWGTFILFFVLLLADLRRCSVSVKHEESGNTNDDFRSMEIDERNINDGTPSHTVDEDSIKSASKKTATKKAVGGTTKSTLVFTHFHMSSID